MTLSEKIAHIRETKRFTKADMAKALEMDFSNYHRLENRGEKLTLEQIDKIAAALEVPRDYLLNYDPDGPKSIDAYYLLQSQGSDPKSEEIEALKTRVAELEDRIRDKSQIIDMLRAESGSYQLTVRDILSGIEDYVCDKYRLGKMRFEGYDKSFEVENTKKGFKQIDALEKENDESYDYVEQTFTEGERDIMFREIFKDDVLLVTVNHLFAWGVVLAPDWIAAAKKFYFKNHQGPYKNLHETIADPTHADYYRRMIGPDEDEESE